ncbi:MAG: hypothetical protein IJ220_02095 [Clostridia bacterium]|nr:hypothetical protein [Clostridia bacterium]
MKKMIDNKVYVEVYEVIKANSDFQNFLPKNVLNEIKKNATNTSYTFRYNPNGNILNQISRDSLSFCISLYLQYGADDNEKEKFKKLLIQNEVMYKNKIHSDAAMADKCKEKIIEDIEKKVRKDLSNVLSEDALGYQYYYELLMKELLKQKGIEWKPKREKNFGIMAD